MNERAQADLEGRFIHYRDWSRYRYLAEQKSRFETTSMMSSRLCNHAREDAISSVYKELYGIFPWEDDEMKDRYEAWCREDAHAA